MPRRLSQMVVLVTESLRWLRAAVCLALVMAAAGCATAGKVSPGQESIAPDSAVVAFSVNTESLFQHETYIRPSRIELRYGDKFITIDINDNKTGNERYLLELPASEISFEWFQLVAGRGIFWSRYRTAFAHNLKLVSGEINYLGRLEINDISFDAYADGPPGTPVEVQLVFTDALEDDLPAWEKDYKLFQGRTPDQRIVGNWGGQEYLYLSYVDSAAARASNIQKTVDGTPYDPIRGPAPERAPR